MTINTKDAQDIIDNAQASLEKPGAATDPDSAAKEILAQGISGTGTAAAPTQDNPNLKTVELDDPIKRGNGVIEIGRAHV